MHSAAIEREFEKFILLNRCIELGVHCARSSFVIRSCLLICGLAEWSAIGWSGTHAANVMLKLIICNYQRINEPTKNIDNIFFSLCLNLTFSSFKESFHSTLLGTSNTGSILDTFPVCHFACFILFVPENCELRKIVINQTKNIIITF